MKSLSQTKQFERDVKRMIRRGKDIQKLKAIVIELAHGRPLAPRHRDHPLIGPWKGSRDCHLEPDWLLIYTATKTELRLERTGTHSDLFKK
ncbi:MAG: type II toxin-antitoxin system YafQ family toxin [Lentisphaerae bacterium]|nr:type II toxin-antitoxin system YafQ family toxin [Lentisphaerota bacterium]